MMQSMVNWKLKEVLEQHGVSGYRLAQLTKGKLSKTSIYGLTTKQPARLELASIDAIITALRSDGHDVDIADLLEYQPDMNALFETGKP